MSPSITAAPHSDQPRRLSILRWTLAFWLFSYALLSAMAQLFPTAPGLFNETRLIATGAGALCFALVLTWTRHAAERLEAKGVAAILATILPASLFVLAARMVTDLLQYGEVRDLSRDVRWAMTWAGYFGLWVSAALAIQWERCRAAQTRRIAAQADDVIVAPTLAASPALSPEAWESAIELLADELSALPAATRSDLAQRLAHRAGYELADDWTGGAHNRRAEIIRRIAGRLEGNASGRGGRG